VGRDLEITAQFSRREHDIILEEREPRSRSKRNGMKQELESPRPGESIGAGQEKRRTVVA